MVLTAADDAYSAVQAMKYGAFDYLVKPIESEKLNIVIDRALERYNLRQERTLHSQKQSFSDLTNHQAFKDMVAKDEKMARVFHQV